MRLRSSANNVAIKNLPVVSYTCKASSKMLVLILAMFLAYENIEIVTRSHPEAFPSALAQKRKTQTKIHESDDALLRVRSMLLAYLYPIPSCLTMLIGH